MHIPKVKINKIILDYDLSNVMDNISQLKKMGATPRWTHMIFEADQTLTAYCFTKEDKMIKWLNTMTSDGNALLRSLDKHKERKNTYNNLDPDNKNWILRMQNELIYCQTKKFRTSVEKLGMSDFDEGFAAKVKEKHLVHSFTIYKDKNYNKTKAPPQPPIDSSNSALLSGSYILIPNLRSLYRGNADPLPPPNLPPDYPNYDENWDRQISSVIIYPPVAPTPPNIRTLLTLCDNVPPVPRELWLWGPGEWDDLDFGNPLNFDDQARSLESTEITI